MNKYVVVIEQYRDADTRVEITAAEFDSNSDRELFFWDSDGNVIAAFAHNTWSYVTLADA